MTRRPPAVPGAPGPAERRTRGRPEARVLWVSPSAEVRVARARAWLGARAPGEEVLVLAATPDAAADLLRSEALARGAAFGWHRATPSRLAAGLAAEALARDGAVPVGRLVAEAVMARVVHAARAEGRLGRFASLAGGPGLVRALSGVREELRLARAAPATVAAESPELAFLCDAFEAHLSQAGLAERVRVLEHACRRAVDPAPHPLLDCPVLLLDVEVASALERDLIAALAARAPALLATVPAGDPTTRRHLEAALGAPAALAPPPEAPAALVALQTHLFEDTQPEPRTPEGDVTVLSAPGEGRECVEIARRIHRLADEGVAFDRIAILLRSPEEYRPHVALALRRAGVPAHFTRGAIHPDPAGRAFVALLACAAEQLSASRFAEYLSLGEVPDAAAGGAPPAPAPSGERWVVPDEEMVPLAVREALESANAPEGAEDPDATPGFESAASRSGASAGAPARGGPELAPVTAGRLRAPRRWETLLLDAAVIGGRARWSRRLDGLANERQRDLDALDDVDDPAAERIRRDLADLAALRDFALPLLDELAALPERAAWGRWLDALSALATRALRRPERVLSVLAELAPMAAVGPVGLGEVQLVLSRRLLDVAVPPASSRHGRVFVAPVEAVRGLAFDVVFVPGLAERLFPRKVEEEPILLDAVRLRIGGLATNDERVMQERRALRLAVGAATRRVVLSYPRLDLDQSRPRVPSFYALEALRAASGRLPGFDELARQAEQVGTARVGWPAPADPADAIDEAEHDLSLLDALLASDTDAREGAARYLLGANPHLGRALRFRARRWLRSWQPADGLVKPSAEAREAIAAHALGARSFSPTALQNFAACPYKFFLYAVHRLAPREVPEAIEEIPALQRGSMVHDVQFQLFGRLRDAGLLPVTPERLEAAGLHLDRVLDEVAKHYEDVLAPAIPRVWNDGVATVRADLRDWLRRASEDASGYVPWLFELSFGLSGRRDRDPHSRDEPVTLEGGLQLRGSIDLVERRADDTLRVTDHKTGKERVRDGAVVAGGEALQPVLYALAVERLFPDAKVAAGRLYYCTTAGGFAACEVPLDDVARRSAQQVAAVIGQALAEPFLPAAPQSGACRWCDYRPVCGPYEELRTGRKVQGPLASLQALRELP